MPPTTASPFTLEMSRRVSFSPEAAAAAPPKHGGGPPDDDGIGENKQKSATRKVWIFKIPKGSTAAFSPASFFRRIGGKMSGALPLPLPLLLTQTQRRRRCCSRKVSSATLLRSHSYAETLDSQRAEAIEDCIEFLNSSASLQRSNSVSSS